MDGIGTKDNIGFLNKGVDQERINTINQLLTELDGFENHEGVVVIAATNQIHRIEPSLLRSGRFNFKVQTRLPT